MVVMEVVVREERGSYTRVNRKLDRNFRSCEISFGLPKELEHWFAVKAN